jgi:hypothetical protein
MLEEIVRLMYKFGSALGFAFDGNLPPSTHLNCRYRAKGWHHSHQQRVPIEIRQLAGRLEFDADDQLGKRKQIR